MGLMKRETLVSHKRAARKMDHHPTTQTEHALIDHGLAALDELEGGQSTIDQRNALAERERQVSLAIKDLQSVLDRYPFGERDLAEARLTAALLGEMLRARGTKWQQEWGWYTPRIAEEMEVDI